MRNKIKGLTTKATKCDSGETLNPFLHLFMGLTFFLALAFLFLGDTTSLQASPLYLGTLEAGMGFVNLWGAIALTVVVCHTAGFFGRGKWLVLLLPVSIFGGAYLWVWASVIYLTGGFFFQFVVLALPNLYFWLWYTLQYRRRKRGERVAFV